MATDPVNARWWLEHRHGAEFKPRVEVEEHDRGAPPLIIRIIPSDRPEEELRQITGLSTAKDQ